MTHSDQLVRSVGGTASLTVSQLSMFFRLKCFEIFFLTIAPYITHIIKSKTLDNATITEHFLTIYNDYPIDKPNSQITYMRALWIWVVGNIYWEKKLLPLATVN